MSSSIKKRQKKAEREMREKFRYFEADPPGKVQKGVKSALKNQDKRRKQVFKMRR